MSLEMKERFSSVTSTGIVDGVSTAPPVPYSFNLNVEHQRTWSDENPIWHLVRREKIEHRFPGFWLDFMSRQDLGAPFTTEKARMGSNWSVETRSGTDGFSRPWRWDLNKGPLVLAGFEHPLNMASSEELQDDNAILFALGGSAIQRVRPGKPQADLAVMLGELKKDGIPSIVGSLFARSKNIREVFRNSGSEYLNAQFGWLPLIRDVQDLCLVVTDTRRVLEAHEKQLNKLLKRTYRFDTYRETTEGLSASLSSYEMHPTQLGSVFSYCRFGTLDGSQVPSDIRTKVTNSHFSGGFRFYYPEIAPALEKLKEFEANANTLLGTRLDPEVLWNLAPWSWLVDWFLNFGDVLGNISAIMADGLVIQYAYIMQETTITQEITLPRGLKTRHNAGFKWDNKPYVFKRDYTRKRRAKASPFGFGLTPEAFTPHQWAILAALGISRGLK